MTTVPAEGYAVEVERLGRWRWLGIVYLLRAGCTPAELVRVRARSEAGARRRAARVIELRERLGG